MKFLGCSGVHEGVARVFWVIARTLQIKRHKDNSFNIKVSILVF